MTYAVGKQHTHQTHKITLYGGVYMCTTCGATASKKLEKLAIPCAKPTAHGKINTEAYIAGNPPTGFPKWPYEHIHLRENVIVNNIQLQIDQLHRQTLRQIYVPPQSSGENAHIDAEEEDRNGLLVPNTEEPYQGSSSSDSD